MNATSFNNHTHTTISSLTKLYCYEQINSSNFLVNTKIINIYLTIIIIVIGLFGNGLAVFVFAQKRFRLHSSSVYLLCLAISDGLFLLMHFFEDTIRTYIDVYLNGETNSLDPICLSIKNQDLFLHSTSTPSTSPLDNKTSLLRAFNITDRFVLMCRLVNYFRYFLRFISAYIIVAFTIQRTIAIYSPFLQTKFESIRIAWIIIAAIALIGGLLNVWVPFLFKPRSLESDLQYCDVEQEFSSAYFKITISYVVLTMLIPIIVIFLCNTLIIFFILKASKERESMANTKLTSKPKVSKLSGVELNSMNKSAIDVPEESTLLPKSQMSSSQLRLSISTPANTKGFNRLSSAILTKPSHMKKSSESNKITRMLLLMSLSYAILNLPYFISWSIFFYNMAFQSLTKAQRFYLFSALNICEIFYILNYAIHFFIYCASGKRFRTQLRDSFNFK